MNTHKTAAALCAGVSALALATSALAQAQGAEVESVVVTATRIQTSGYTAPTPVTVAPIEELQRTTPTTIAAALNKLPQFEGSTASAGNGNGAGSGPPNLFSGNFLNLRNMGAIRTLILLDGRRVPSTAGNGTVDTNTLPQMLVQRVDVVTGGASAVYGSDAVTGVVNYILDTRYTGFKVNAQTGISDYGDAPQTKIGVAGGVSLFGDRGHFVFSAEHFQNAGIKRAEDRDFLAPIYVLLGQGTAASPYVTASNARLSGTSAGGLATTGPFAGQQFVGAGALAPFNRGTPTQNAGVSIGGDGAYFYDNQVGAPSRYDQVFGRFQYEFSDDVTGFMQLSWSESGTSNFHRSNMPELALTIFNGNAYLPASAQAQLTATNTASFVMSRFPRDIGLNASLFQRTNAINFTTGLMGEFRDKYRWEAYYTHGESRVRSRRQNNPNLVNLYAGLDAVRDPGGNIVCRVTLTNPGLYPGCQPINMFGERNQSQQALDYLYEDTNFQILNKMDNFAASISGDVLQAWAGPLSMAVNFEYRQQSITQTTSASPTVVPNTTGIRLGAGPRTTHQFDLLAPQSGQNSVWETSAEMALPLIVDAPFVKRLDVTGAVRYTEYSSSGPATTWKVGLNYQPFDDLRFRYTESRDIRAPTLLDLYSGATVANVSFNDTLHTGISRTNQLRGGGNPNLVPEVSRTTTLGAVYQPSWFPRFQMSVDYYNIHINNGIATLSGNNAEVFAECEASGGTSELCDLIVRPLPFSDRSAANFPLFIRSTNVNISEVFTKGVDVEASYRFALSALAPSLPGNLNLRLLYTYQPVLKSRSLATSPLVNASGAEGLSTHRATATVAYDAGPFSLRWLARYQSGVERTNNPLLFYADPALKAVMTHDLNIGYDFKVAEHDLQASLTVGNVFNKKPQISPPTNSPGSPGAFSPAVGDTIGRYFTFGLRAEL